MKQEYNWNSVLAVHEYFSNAQISIEHLNKIAPIGYNPYMVYLINDCFSLYFAITNKYFDLSILFDQKSNLQIKYLFLNGLDIEDIFPIKELYNLEVINCGVGNSIDSLVPLKRLSNLKEIYFSENKINNLEPISELINLEIVDLSENFITNVGKLYNLTNLKVLLLGGNKIERIDDLSNLLSLEQLDISFNEIKEIICLKKLRNLKTLIISGNFIDVKEIIELGKQIKSCEIFFDFYDYGEQEDGYLMIKTIDVVEVPFLLHSYDRTNNIDIVYIRLLDNEIKVKSNIIEEMKNILRETIVAKQRSKGFIQEYINEDFFVESSTFVRGQFDY